MPPTHLLTVRVTKVNKFEHVDVQWGLSLTSLNMLGGKGACTERDQGRVCLCVVGRGGPEWWGGAGASALHQGGSAMKIEYRLTKLIQVQKNGIFPFCLSVLLQLILKYHI